MVAPKKNEEDKRTYRIAIRMTEDEDNNLRKFVKNKTNYTLSEFIRQAINEKQLLTGGFGFQSIQKL